MVMREGGMEGGKVTREGGREGGRTSAGMVKRASTFMLFLIRLKTVRAW